MVTCRTGVCMPPKKKEELPWRKRDDIVQPDAITGMKLNPLAVRINKITQKIARDKREQNTLAERKPAGRPKGVQRSTPPLLEEEIAMIKANHKKKEGQLPKAHFCQIFNVSPATVNKAIAGDYDKYYRKNNTMYISKQGYEATFKGKQVMPFLNKLPRTVAWTNHIGNDAGRPDVFAVISGLFVAIEVKKSISELNKHRYKKQRTNLIKVQHCGGVGIVAFPENWKYVKEYLKYLASLTFNPNFKKVRSDFEFINKVSPQTTRRIENDRLKSEG